MNNLFKEQGQRKLRMLFKVNFENVHTINAFQQLVDSFINEGDNKAKVKTWGDLRGVQLDEAIPNYFAYAPYCTQPILVD